MFQRFIQQYFDSDFDQNQDNEAFESARPKRMSRLAVPATEGRPPKARRSSLERPAVDGK